MASADDDNSLMNFLAIFGQKESESIELEIDI
jgi:hypothetical protein